jgi:Chaperone of endosialidase
VAGVPFLGKEEEMTKLTRGILLILFVLVLSASVIFAEDITITTYYPSPYGSYNALFTDKLGVGDNNGDSSFTAADVPTTTGQVWIKGKVGIGTMTPGTYALSVVGTAGLSTGTAWTNTSDQRWKDVNSELKGNSLSKILALHPISYTWNEIHDKKFGKNLGIKYGFIAQEVQGIFPTMISQDAEGYFWYNPSGMEAILTAAIQEQQDMIKAQQVEIDGLKVRLEKLERRLILAGK